jgi:hypothetical protein
MWVADGNQRRRLAAYAGSLVATTGIAYLLFASNANRQAVCDALSQVWLSDALIGGAVMLLLARLTPERWPLRLAGAVAAGAIVAAFHALMWPGCLQRLEGVSPEATRLWLDHVREARPVYRHGWRIATIALALPVTSLAGWSLLAWHAWRQRSESPDLLARTLAVALPALAAFALLFWQMRAAPAAQMMALPGATALIVLVAARWLDSRNLLLHGAAIVLVLLSVGALVPVVLKLVPDTKSGTMSKRVAMANRRCPTLAALTPVQRQPQGMIFTFIDLGPRIIVVTHHDAVGGPYHRNDRAIADVMTAFRGDEPQARRIIAEYGSDYLLVCPDMSTATIFMSEAPNGFYGQLMKGNVPDWLEPVDLGKGSPFRMWRVRRS